MIFVSAVIKYEDNFTCHSKCFTSQLGSQWGSVSAPAVSWCSSEPNQESDKNNCWNCNISFRFCSHFKLQHDQSRCSWGEMVEMGGGQHSFFLSPHKKGKSTPKQNSLMLFPSCKIWLLESPTVVTQKTEN